MLSKCRKKTIAVAAVLFVSAVVFVSTKAAAWPLATQWIPVYKSSVLLQDSVSDANTERNVVSDTTHDAAFIFNDGTYLYYRLRLDASPSGGGGQNQLKPYGWGVLLDTNQNAADYEWMFMVDGISNPETINFWQNTTQAIPGNAADPPEVLTTSIAASGNIVISAADTSINGDQDYFLDWRFPYSTFKTATGLSDNSVIRMWFGTSNNASTMGGDLVGGADLYTAVTDNTLVSGQVPTTGSVMFVADLTGAGDVTQSDAGVNLYIKVTDMDRNSDPAVVQTVSVVLTSTRGESETVTLTETGANTGAFTGTIATASAQSITANNGSLQVMPSETITVTYTDAIDASSLANRPRTDTVVISPPVVTVSKAVNTATATSGSNVTYTITITNSGAGDGWVSSIIDTLPAGFTYATGTTTGLTTANPTISGQNLTWSGAFIVPKKSGGINGTLTLSFQAKALGSYGTYYNNVSVTGANFTTATTGNAAPVLLTAPQITLTKSADNASVAPGGTVTYTIYYKNVGTASAQNLVIKDTVPSNATYVTGSLRMGAATTTYATAAAKTDAADGDEANITSGTITFNVTTVTADDSVAGSGTDEGKVYFKMQIN